MKRRLIFGLLLIGACAESFLPPSAVVDLRQIGALVEIDGKPGRANPDPGDMVQVSNLVIDRGFPPTVPPEPPPLSPPPLQWRLVACIPAPSVLETPICQNVIPCEGCEEVPPDDPLAFPIARFQIPSAEELDAAEATSVVLQGAICAEGEPAELDAIIRLVRGDIDVLEPCKDPDDEGRFISVEIPIEDQPENPNLNPAIADVTLNGNPWPPPFDQEVPRDQSNTDCADLVEDRSVLPRADGSISIIQLEATSESFQQYLVDDVFITEEIQVSWLADGGAFESSFSFISDPARSAIIQWAPPNFPNDMGRVVRLNFVIRDGRGGIDRVERGLCVIP
ncbi:MAG: hypothetical protein OEM15_17095 [Myxococcales bacterium]|nr:hypothetical protein [Myxococcales bacterium]MDH3484124.1 hypothetical protein [Myxococcales bacterium]